MRLNNKKMAYFRKQQFYDAIFADLVLMGALPKNVVEDYFNAYIPPELSAPWSGPPQPYPTQPVTDLDLTSKFTAPVKNGDVVRDFDSEQYTGTIVWHVGTASGTIFTDDTFNGSTVYVAIVTLVAKAGYTTEGLAGNDFNYTGATSVSNSAVASQAVVTFPATAL
jgi:hypothetical protein